MVYVKGNHRDHEVSGVSGRTVRALIADLDEE